MQKGTVVILLIIHETPFLFSFCWATFLMARVYGIKDDAMTRSQEL